MSTTSTTVDSKLTNQITSPVAVEPSVVDPVLNQANPSSPSNFQSGDLAVGNYHELAVDFNLSSITGGTSPTFAVVVKRKGADGVYYTIDNPAALTSVSALSRSLGAGLAQNVSFGNLIQVQVNVTGAPTAAAWTLSILGKQAV